jgi:uncharacterized membrane protein YjfL (UPF0719 family)
MKLPKTLFSRLSLISIALCAACCTLPFLGAIVSVGALTMLAKYFEWAGIAALILSIIFFIVYLLKKTKAPSCDIDCKCKTPESPLVVPEK